MVGFVSGAAVQAMQSDVRSAGGGGRLDALAPRWTEAALAGRTVEAVKIVRLAGLDLPDACAVVKGFQREHGMPMPSPWWHRVWPCRLPSRLRNRLT